MVNIIGLLTTFNGISIPICFYFFMARLEPETLFKRSRSSFTRLI